ncbi:hypothetical protein STAS_33668 [Striga asiatica]|uniref:Glycosyltransferase family 92 protein n=1 Tax=Striga asiatica TaxID=4170 RepID=A0A5A7RFK3_STRAF|nr:hypothetical protein STAS_33668 [Striga asiatica]
MESSDQRRKRKRILRQYSSTSYSCYLPRHFLSVRSLLVCFSFLTFIYTLSYRNHFLASAFRPALVDSSLSVLSSSSSRTVKSVREFRRFFSPVRIESRVFLPDHVLLLVSGGKGYGFLRKSRDEGFECVYYSKIDDSRKYSSKFLSKSVISVDEFDGFRWVARCPLPPVNYSNAVDLKSGKNPIFGGKNRLFSTINRIPATNSWENLAYEAVLDRDSVVVFVKGLNLRPGRESNPSPFTCHFGLFEKQSKNTNNSYTLSTRALTAAQEVVRCPLPIALRKIDHKSQQIRITVGFTPRVHHNRALVPSVAKIIIDSSKPKSRDNNNNNNKTIKKRHELCVCTMVWNQASAIREWIMYHSWLGVEKFFIYDNNSDDGLDEAVERLNLENYKVSRRIWPWVKTQEAGFSHCALRARDECHWVSFMDVDEYFYFPYSTPAHQMYRPLGHATMFALRELVSNFSANVGEIRASCHSFGPSGLSVRPVKGVAVGYTCRLQSPERHKSVVRPEAVDPTLLNVVHHFKLREGFDYVNLPLGTVMINHYKYQVWEVFRAKFYRRVATYVVDWRENQNEGSRDRAPGLGTEAIEPPDWPKRFCEVWDTGLRDFVLANLADLSTGLLPWERGSGLGSG